VGLTSAPALDRQWGGPCSGSTPGAEAYGICAGAEVCGVYVVAEAEAVGEDESRGGRQRNLEEGGREGGVRQSSSKERLVARREGEELWEGGEAVGEQSTGKERDSPRMRAGGPLRAKCRCPCSIRWRDYSCLRIYILRMQHALR
jgi:hypothetical protein